MTASSCKVRGLPLLTQVPKRGGVVMIQPQNKEEVDNNPEEDKAVPMHNHVGGGGSSPKEAIIVEDTSGFPNGRNARASLEAV